MLDEDKAEELAAEITVMLKHRYALKFVYTSEATGFMCFDVIDLDFADEFQNADFNQYYVRGNAHFTYHEVLNDVFLQAEDIVNWYEEHSIEVQAELRR